MKKEDLKIGQVLYLKPINNASRRGDGEIKETYITKIGKKYIIVHGHYGRYFIDSLLQDAGQYSSNYQAYTTRQQIEEEREMQTLRDKLRKYFDGVWGESRKLTLQQLRKVDNIISEK